MRNPLPIERHFTIDPPLRHLVAVEAARLLYRREYKEYYHAKREAARRHRCKILPTNSEIHGQLRLIAERTEGEERAARLARMRATALSVMERMAAFRPRLVGSVWTGHIRAGSDIDIHLYSDSPSAVRESLQGTGYSEETVVARGAGSVREFLHFHLSEGEFEVEFTLHSEAEFEEHPNCSITGGPMERADIGELRARIGETAVKPVVEDGSGHPLLQALKPPLQWEVFRPDEYRLRVARTLEGYLSSGYELLEEVGDEVLLHLRSSGAGGWDRGSLLLLAALDSNLENPALPESVAAWLESTLAGEVTAESLSQSRPRPSALYRFFRRHGPSAPEQLLLSLARVDASTADPVRFQEQRLFVKEMLAEYFEGGFLRFPTLPVSATDLETEFGLREAKMRERLLEQLTRDYLDGVFQGREDGLSRGAELLDSPRELW